MILVGPHECPHYPPNRIFIQPDWEEASERMKGKIDRDHLQRRKRVREREKEP